MVPQSSSETEKNMKFLIIWAAITAFCVKITLDFVEAHLETSVNLIQFTV